MGLARVGTFTLNEMLTLSADCCPAVDAPLSPYSSLSFVQAESMTMQSISSSTEYVFPNNFNTLQFYMIISSQPPAVYLQLQQLFHIARKEEYDGIEVLTV